jgi:hypothetical protein
VETEIRITLTLRRPLASNDDFWLGYKKAKAETISLQDNSLDLETSLRQLVDANWELDYQI